MESPSLFDKTPIKIAVVGAGAVGGFYGAKLARIGHDVHFLFRSDFEHVQENGLSIKSFDGDFELKKVQAHQTTNDIGPSDLVIIAIKTTANQILEKLIPPLLHSQTALLTLQNGLGNEEFLAKLFGEERVLGGLCFVCLNRIAPGCIQNFAHGTIVIGEQNRLPQPRTHDIAQQFQKAGIDCRLAENLAEARWRKLVWNIPFNGLSIVAGGIDVTEIVTRPELLKITRELMHEVIGIANRLGFLIPMSFAEKQIERTLQMGPYRPSSLIDFLEKRPIEVESIFGEPYRRGVEMGVPTPHLEMLYGLLKSIAKR